MNLSPGGLVRNIFFGGAVKRVIMLLMVRFSPKAFILTSRALRDSSSQGQALQSQTRKENFDGRSAMGP